MPEQQPRATILLVDDREANRYAVSRILHKAGFAVRETASGREALRLSADKPDLLILDINLPDISGYDVCREIKANPATAAIPVLHLSASLVDSENRSAGLEGGADGYLVYPLEPRELVAHVEALLRVRRAEKEARGQRELLRVTLSSIADGVIATDRSGIITFINPVARELTGWAEDGALHKPIGAVFHLVDETTRQGLPNPVEEVIRAGTCDRSNRHELLVARDGTPRPVEESASLILDDDGRFVGVVLVFRDIVERRRLETELRRRSEDLAERDRRKDEFLAMLAHELRNPLAPITNALQLLKFNAAREVQVELVRGMLDRQVRHLVRLVDDLMDVSRITRGKFELRKERLDLAAVIARAVEGARLFFEERQHVLHVVCGAAALFVDADPARMEQVLSNLLINAGKYTPPGGKIELIATREAHDAVIRVRDNGIGIRPEMLPRLFDMFEQADRLPGRMAEGLGLGLALVRTLVEMHGGSVTASSAGPGLGSEFVVRLRAVSALADSVPEPQPREAAMAGPMRILIADDNVDSAESLAMVLRSVGHEVRTAADGQQALDVAASFRPEAVFLDIGMPHGMDGYEVARRLREQSGHESILIVAVTGYGQPGDIAHAEDAGFDYHMTKPAPLGEIQRLLVRAQS